MLKRLRAKFKNQPATPGERVRVFIMFGGMSLGLCAGMAMMAASMANQVWPSDNMRTYTEMDVIGWGIIALAFLGMSFVLLTMARKRDVPAPEGWGRGANPPSDVEETPSLEPEEAV